VPAAVVYTVPAIPHFGVGATAASPWQSIQLTPAGFPWFGCLATFREVPTASPAALYAFAGSNTVMVAPPPSVPASALGEPLDPVGPPSVEAGPPPARSPVWPLGRSPKFTVEGSAALQDAITQARTVAPSSIVEARTPR